MKRSNRILMALVAFCGIVAAAIAVESNGLYRVTISEASLSRETFHEGEVSVTTVTLTNANKVLETFQLLQDVTLVNTTNCAAIVRATAPLTFTNLTDSLYLMVNGRTYVYPNATNVLTILQTLSGVAVTNMANITNVTKNGG